MAPPVAAEKCHLLFPPAGFQLQQGEKIGSSNFPQQVGIAICSLPDVYWGGIRLSPFQTLVMPTPEVMSCVPFWLYMHTLVGVYYGRLGTCIYCKDIV